MICQYILTKYCLNSHTVSNVCSRSIKYLLTRYQMSAHTISNVCSHDIKCLLTRYQISAHTVSNVCSHGIKCLLTRYQMSPHTISNICPLGIKCLLTQLHNCIWLFAQFSCSHCCCFMRTHSSILIILLIKNFICFINNIDRFICIVLY